ncbi:efflux RND transporter permease subunit [Fusibacter bizertensis]
MNKLIRVAIHERKVTFLLATIIFLYGIYAYYYIPKQENPDTSSPLAQIITVYPGATANEVEEQVTQKIEDELATLDGVENITSYSNPNVSIVILTLNYDVDYDEQWAKMRVLLDALKNELPSNVLDYQIETDLMTSAGIIISLSGETYSYEQLGAYAETYKKDLEDIEGVKQIVIDGLPKKNLEIKVDLKKLQGLPLALKDIFDLVTAQSVSIPAGSIQSDYGKIGVKNQNDVDSITKTQNLIVYGSKDTGALLRLKDIADVSFEYDRQQHSYKQGENNSVLLTVYFSKNQNVVLIGNEIRDKINTINSKMPANLNVNEVLFQPEEVSRSIEGFIMNLLQGMIFVIIVVLVGMGIRNAIVVSIAIPLSMTMTVIAMKLIGVDIQQMSIAALIIALGMLVDNSIVISDSIQIKINEGLEIKQACYEGTVEQSIPVLTSTLTTVVAFAPLIVLPGEAGEFAKSLPQVVIIALIASYMVAMFVTPALASLMFKNTHKENAPKNRIRHFFENGLKGALKMPQMALFFIMIILMGTFYAASLLPIELFPYADKDIIYIDVFSEKDGDIEYTEAVTKELRDLLKSEAPIVDVSSSIGGGFPKFYLTVGVRPPSDNYSQLLIKVDMSKTTKFDSREAYAYYLQRLVDDKLTGGTATVNLLEINQPGPAVDIRISGEDREDVKRVSDQLYEVLLNNKQTINVQNDSSSYEYQYVISQDNAKASTLGLTNYDIQLQTSLALNGMKAATLEKNGKTYDINVSGNIDDLDDLMNLQIKSTATGEKVLLKQFSTVALEKELSSIKRLNRNSSISVSADVMPGYSVNELQSWIENSVLPGIDQDGVEITFGGDQEVFDKYISGLLGAAAIAIVTIYIILLIQFNSMMQPFIILATVPLSIIGSVITLLIFKQNVTFTVGLGVASLIGVVVNNAILLIEYINRERRLNRTVYEACVNSVDRRFRPIMLSTITTVIGLVPMSLSGSSFFSPMAIALMGGLSVSTLLTLIVIPLIYFQTHKREN